MPSSSSRSRLSFIALLCKSCQGKGRDGLGEMSGVWCLVVMGLIGGDGEWRADGRVGMDGGWMSGWMDEWMGDGWAMDG